MVEVIAWIWIAVTLALGAAWAAADLAHNRRCGTWDVGRTLSRLPTVLLVAMWWPILFPASCIGRARNRKR
jgi:hypothetical protein